MINKELQKRFIENKDPLTDIIGQQKEKDMIRAALIAGRHIILVGPPGIGKTTIAKNIAKNLGKTSPFVRVQGSPDLTVEDLLGDIDPMKALKFGPLSVEHGSIPHLLARGYPLQNRQLERRTYSLQVRTSGRQRAAAKRKPGAAGPFAPDGISAG